MQRELYERQQLRDAALQSVIKELLQQSDMKMADFQSMLQIKVQEAMMQMQAGMAQAQGQSPAGSAQPTGQEPAQQGVPLPSDAAMSGQGFNAAAGGIPPQEGNPGITKNMRP